MAEITLQRVYDFHGPAQQYCYLTDRLWPRGISKERLQGVVWLKEVAPETELRQWFHHHTDQWDAFNARYRQQLEASEYWKELLEIVQQGHSLTLLFGSKDVHHNQAVVLRDFLHEKLQEKLNA